MRGKNLRWLLIGGKCEDKIFRCYEIKRGGRVGIYNMVLDRLHKLWSNRDGYLFIFLVWTFGEAKFVNVPLIGKYIV